MRKLYYGYLKDYNLVLKMKKTPLNIHYHEIKY